MFKVRSAVRAQCGHSAVLQKILQRSAVVGRNLAVQEKCARDNSNFNRIRRAQPESIFFFALNRIRSRSGQQSNYTHFQFFKKAKQECVRSLSIFLNRSRRLSNFFKGLRSHTRNRRQNLRSRFGARV